MRPRRASALGTCLAIGLVALVGWLALGGYRTWQGAALAYIFLAAWWCFLIGLAITIWRDSDPRE
jgi:peptidoglycan/LPS O-acetylase OafA/YrhL